MEQKNFLHSFVRIICGKKSILMITDASQILSRQQEFEKNNLHQEALGRISESIRNAIISGGALSIALSLSMMRYFPGKFSSFGLNKMLMDTGLIGICLFVATTTSLKSNNGEIGKIKKELMLNYDQQFLNHMAEIQIKYEIDEEDQVRGLFTTQQYQEWAKKRYEHIL